MLILVWLLAVWGLTAILTRSRIFRGARDRLEIGSFLGDFARCPRCVGFWVGLGGSLLGFSLARPLALPVYETWLIDALAASAWAAFAALVEDALCGIASLMVKS